MGGFGGFRMPQFGGQYGGGLPQPPRIGMPQPGRQGGVYGMGGMMPYQPDPMAQTIGAVGQFMQGFGAMKEGQKNKAKQEFFDNLNLISTGLIPNPDYNHMAKLAKKAGLPFDFNNTAMATPNLGNGQQQQAPQQQAQPQMPQGPMPPPNPAMQQPGPGAPPPGYLDPQTLPMRQMNPLAMQGQYNLTPQQGMLGKMGNAMGMGSAPVAPNAPVVQQLQKFGQNAANMRQMQQAMQGMEMQSKLSEFQDREQQAQMMRSLVSDQLPPEQRFKAMNYLTMRGALKVIDLPDLLTLRVSAGGSLSPQGYGDLVKAAWQVKDGKGYTESLQKITQSAIDSGHTPEEAARIADDLMSGRSPSVPMNASAEQQKKWADNIETALKLYPGLDKYMADPLIAENVKLGNFGVIRTFLPQLVSKPELDAREQSFGMKVKGAELGLREKGLGIDAMNAQTSRMNAGTSAFSAQTGRMQYDLAKEKAELDKIVDPTMKAATIAAHVKDGKLTPEQGGELMSLISATLPGSSVQKYENPLGPFNEKPLQLNAPPAYKASNGGVLGQAATQPQRPGPQMGYPMPAAGPYGPRPPVAGFPPMPTPYDDLLRFARGR